MQKGKKIKLSDVAVVCTTINNICAGKNQSQETLMKIRKNSKRFWKKRSRSNLSSICELDGH